MVRMVSSSCRAVNSSVRNSCGSSSEAAITRCSSSPTWRAMSPTRADSRRAIEDTMAYVSPNGDVGCSRPRSIRSRDRPGLPQRRLERAPSG